MKKNDRERKRREKRRKARPHGGVARIGQEGLRTGGTVPAARGTVPFAKAETSGCHKC